MSDSLQKLALSCTFAMHNGTLQISKDERPSPSELSTLGAGAIVDSKYKIIGLIGEGGMGAVFKVHHLLLQKDMALKTFRSHSLSPESWQRFQREAQAIAKLKHKNIVEVFDFGISQTKIPYYTMELLVGESLAERLARTGKVDPIEALRIFVQTSEALAHAHRQQIVHRDIKPANIFLQQREVDKATNFRVKIVDFGIAKLAEASSAHDNQLLTQVGAIFGSPLYMSPEQSLGLAVDQRTDIYSAGCALFESLVGYPPFRGDNALSTLLYHQTKDPPRLKDVLADADLPQRLDNLVATLLAKAPEKRYQSFDQVVSELNYCLEDLAAKPVTDTLIGVDSGAEGSVAIKAPGSVVPTSKARTLVIGALVIGLASVCLVVIPQMLSSQGPGKSGGRTVQQPQKETATRAPIKESACAEVVPDRYKVERGKACLDNTPFESSTKAGLRQFQFPGYTSLGFFQDWDKDKLRKDCRGPGPVTVPKNWILVFHATDEPYKSPELLERFQGSSLYGLQLDCAQESRQWNSGQLAHIVNLKSLRYLNVSYNRNVGPTAMKYIEKLPALTKLDVSHSGIDGEAMTHLKVLPELTDLTVNRTVKISALLNFMGKDPGAYRLQGLTAQECRITDDDLVNIAKLKNLRQLHLKRNSIRGSKLNSLTGLKHLTLLDLEENPLDHDVVEALSQMKALSCLYVEHSQLTDADSGRLKQQLPQCNIEWARAGNKDAGFED